MIRSDEVRSEFELTLLEKATLAGKRRATVGTGGEPVEGRGGDERPADPPGTNMVSEQCDQVALRLSSRQRAIVAACDVPRSMAELMERAGVSYRSHFCGGRGEGEVRGGVRGEP